jgi:hypothetical protein
MGMIESWQGRNNGIRNEDSPERAYAHQPKYSVDGDTCLEIQIIAIAAKSTKIDLNKINLASAGPFLLF